MTEIPDDVVERANKARLDAIFKEADTDATVSYLQSSHVQLIALRAAGRIFVEWERERMKALYEHAIKTRVYYAEERNNERARAEAAERKLAASLAQAP